MLHVEKGVLPTRRRARNGANVLHHRFLSANTKAKCTARWDGEKEEKEIRGEETDAQVIWSHGDGGQSWAWVSWEDVIS
jgi:hypothetical protein